MSQYTLRFLTLAVNAQDLGLVEVHLKAHLVSNQCQMLVCEYSVICNKL